MSCRVTGLCCSSAGWTRCDQGRSWPGEVRADASSPSAPLLWGEINWGLWGQKSPWNTESVLWSLRAGYYRLLFLHNEHFEINTNCSEAFATKQSVSKGSHCWCAHYHDDPGWAVDTQPCGTGAASISGEHSDHIGLASTAAERPGRGQGWQPWLIMNWLCKL